MATLGQLVELVCSKHPPGVAMSPSIPSMREETVPGCQTASAARLPATASSRTKVNRCSAEPSPDADQARGKPAGTTARVRSTASDAPPPPR